MANYPNPCEKCPNEPQCNRGCPEWTKRVKTIWKQFNGYSQRAYEPIDYCPKCGRKLVTEDG